MPTTRKELEAMLDAAIASRATSGDPIGDGRRLFLIHVKELIRDHGFPVPESLKLDACSMPFVFQELNYDDYDWSIRTADLGHLTDIVEVDVILWSDGRSRKELTDAEYREYQSHCLNAIDYRRRRRS